MCCHMGGALGSRRRVRRARADANPTKKHSHESEEVVRAFFDTLAGDGRTEAASRYMAPDVTLEVDGEPPTVGRERWLARQGMFEGSFPDMHETPTIDRVDGNVVVGTNSVTATHTGDLDMPARGMGVIPATNRRVSMTLDVAWTVEDERITHMAASMRGGPAAFAEQLGIQLPGPD